MSPKSILYISNGFLRSMRESDVTDDYISGLNDPQVNKYLLVRHDVQTYDSITSFVIMNKDSSDMILWGVWYGEELKKSLVGTLRLHEIDDAESSCCIGICLFKKTVWGKGLGSQTIRTATTWALNNLGLHTVRAGVYAENVGSQQAFSRAGYKFSHKKEMRYSGDQNISSIHIYLAKKEEYLLDATYRQDAKLGNVS